MADYGKKGWIKLWRSELDNPLYSEKSFSFDKWHAWMDLCLMADDKETVKTSLKALKNRWFWGSTKKVRNYLETVSEMGLVTVICTPNKGTQIRINTGFSAKNDRNKKHKKETVEETVKEIEEVLLKEVGGRTSLKIRSSPEEKKEMNFSELNEMLGEEYE